MTSMYALNHSDPKISIGFPEMVLPDGEWDLDIRKNSASTETESGSRKYVSAVATDAW